jgi:hypothetical protein
LARLLLILLIPLVLAMLVRDPQAVMHLVVLVFTVGGKMLSATAAFLDRLLGGH